MDVLLVEAVYDDEPTGLKVYKEPSKSYWIWVYNICSTERQLCQQILFYMCERRNVC